MKLITRMAMAGALLVSTTLVMAEQTIEQKVKAAFSKSFPTSTVENVKASPLKGIYAVTVDNGQVLYMDETATYLLTGDMFELNNTGYVNITEKAKEEGRAKILKNLAVKDMIVFSPEGETKAYINVFTDVDCYYCQKLHKEVADLNKVGIEVRYLAFPRAGKGSSAYKKVVSAWCSKDKKDAMNKLKARQNIPEKLCSANPVDEHYNAGLELGVKGTPAMMTKEGRMMPGYMPAYALAQSLGVKISEPLASELKAKAQKAMQR